MEKKNCLQGYTKEILLSALRKSVPAVQKALLLKQSTNEAVYVCAFTLLGIHVAFNYYYRSATVSAFEMSFNAFLNSR